MSRESALSDRSRRVLPPIAEGEKRIESVRPPRLVAHRTASHRFERDGWRPSHCERRSRLLPPATDRGIILLHPDRRQPLESYIPHRCVIGLVLGRECGREAEEEKKYRRVQDTWWRERVGISVYWCCVCARACVCPCGSVHEKLP